MTPLDPTQLDLAARAIAGFGLAGAAMGAPARALDDGSWRALLGRIAVDRTWGLLGTAIAAGHWPVSDTQQAEVLDREAAAAGGMLALDRDLELVADILDGASIPWRLLKGPAAAQHLWADWWLRPYSDLDILVRRDDFAEAFGLLVDDLGAGATTPRSRWGSLGRYGKGTNMTQPSGREIDLHAGILAGPLGVMLPEADLFSGDSTVLVGDRRVACPEPEVVFIHACLHARFSVPGRSIIPLRDVAEGTTGFGNGLDPSRLEELAGRWRCRDAVIGALRRSRDCFDLRGPGPLDGWVRANSGAGVRGRWRERGWWAVSASTHPAAPIGQMLLMPVVLDSWGDRLDYVRSVLLHEGRAPWRARVGRLARRLGGTPPR